MMNKRYICKQVITLSISMVLTSCLLAQRDTIKPIWSSPVLTTSSKLIEFKNKLANLNDLCDLSRSLKAFDIYKDLMLDQPNSIQDTALLMFMRFHLNNYDYFDCPDSKPYEYFFVEPSLIDSLIDKENRIYLNPLGWNLISIEHGDIESYYYPAFFENLFNKYVRKEVQDFLHYWSLDESIELSHCWEDDCNEHIMLLEEMLLLTENYVQSNQFFKNKIDENYFYYLILYTVGHQIKFGNKSGYGFDYFTFHIQDTNLANIYDDFSVKYTNSKTTWLINKLRSATEFLEEEQLDQLFHLLMQLKCPEDELFDCDCREENFTYDNFHDNINEIIRCFEEGYEYEEY